MRKYADKLMELNDKNKNILIALFLTLLLFSLYSCQYEAVPVGMTLPVGMIVPIGVAVQNN